MNAELEYDANFNEESAPLIDNQATSTTNYVIEIFKLYLKNLHANKLLIKT